MPKKPAYKDLAHYYDVINANKDYKTEARKIKSLIQKYKKTSGNSLLEVACGTGKHIAHLKDSYSVIGTDLNKEMLVIAKQNFPDVTFKQADMINMNLRQTFDAVICLFSSIGYVKNYRNLAKTIKNFSNHLNKGGVLIIEPWLTEADYVSSCLTGLSKGYTHDGNEITISLQNECSKRGMLSVIELHLLISERHKKIKYCIEKHELALFDKKKILEIMRKSGLTVSFEQAGLQQDLGLYIGVKK